MSTDIKRKNKYGTRILKENLALISCFNKSKHALDFNIINS